MSGFQDASPVDTAATLAAPVAPVSGPSQAATKLSVGDMAKMWLAKGYPSAAAMGIAQNMQRESGGDPTIPGDHGTSLGLFQHHDSRMADLTAFARQQGKSPTDPQVQVDFADKEMREGMPGLHQQLMASRDPAQAESAFRTIFERPASNPQMLPSGERAKLTESAATANQIMTQMLADNQVARGQLDKAIAARKPFEPTPPPQQPDMDPLKSFGSIATIFATLAAGLSKTPAVAAMNGLAGALNGAQQHDWNAYQTGYKQWKDGTDYALKMHEQQSGDIKDALDMIAHNVNAGTAMLRANAAVYQDEILLPLIIQGKHDELARIVQERDAQAQSLAKGRPEADAALKLTAASSAVDAAAKAGDPEQMAAAKSNYDTAMQRYRDIKQAPYTARTGAASGQNIALQRFLSENPQATAQEIQQFTLGFKEDAPGVAGRKDRAQDEKERANQMNADHRDRMATIAEDRAISTTERDRRLSEERERHDKALEALMARKVDATIARNAVAPSTPEERESAAAQASTGMPISQIIPGYGPSAVADRKQVRNDAIQKIIADTGMSSADAGIELANRTIEFQSGKKSSGQLTTMLGATRQAVSQLDFNIKKTKEEMAKLPSTDLAPIINAIARGEEKWTGAPAYSSLYYYMHATAMESARILSGGQASIAQLNQGAADEAAKWASIGMTPASFNAVAKAMEDEGHYRLQTFEDALRKQRVGAQPTSAGGPSPPSSAAGDHPEVPTAITTKPGLQWSASRQQWRDSAGKIYDKTGAEVQ